jgi:hypothetical protein
MSIINDNEIIYTSLSMRKNYITTGNVYTSITDVVNMKEGHVKILTSEQMKLVIKIEEMMAFYIERIGK